MYIGITGSLPAQNVWDSNFVAVYHMNDNPAGDGILDSTSNANHGTKGAGAAAPTEVDGLVGKAQSFDGVDDLITLPLNSTLLSEFTYQILSRLDSYKLYNTQVAYMHDNSPSTTGWMLRREEADRVSFYVYRQGETGATVAIQTPSYDEYLLWTAIFQSTQMSLQINDGTPDTKNFDASTIVASGQNDWIGAPVENNSNHTWKDLISEIRISSTARDGGWISATNLTLMDSLIRYEQQGKYRYKCIIPSGRVSANLSNFPVYIKLGIDAGTNLSDTRGLLDRDWWRGLCVKTSDGSNCPVEVATWTPDSGYAELHVKLPEILASSDNYFYLLNERTTLSCLHV